MFGKTFSSSCKTWEFQFSFGSVFSSYKGGFTQNLVTAYARLMSNSSPHRFTHAPLAMTRWIFSVSNGLQLLKIGLSTLDCCSCQWWCSCCMSEDSGCCSDSRQNCTLWPETTPALQLCDHLCHCPVASAHQRWSDSVFLLFDPILFLKRLSVSDPNPVLVEIILSVSENYPKVYYDAQHTFLCFVYFAS